MSNELMRYDPATGENKPYPSHDEQYRIYHGTVAWLFNPWTGKIRDARDVGSDCFGYAIVPTDLRGNEIALNATSELVKDK